MKNGEKQADIPSVDKTLVAMFLKMSPEERLRANDNAIRAILEMRHAFKQRQDNDPKDRHRLTILKETLKQLED